MANVQRHRYLRAASALALAMPVLALATPAMAEDAAVVRFHIPAQPVQSALAMFARQSGIQILFPYEQVAGLRTQSVNGKMAHEAALSRLIAGTGLKINRTSGDVIALSFAKRMPDGRKRVKMASLSVTSLPASLGMAMQSTAAATAVIAPQATDDVNAGEAIVVTGSRGQGRTVIDSPTPIDVISGAELERTGKAGVFSALNTLVPSFNLPVRAGGATSTIIATGGLRGLNPDQTLILVNGKRRHKTSLINAVSTLYNGSVPADLDMIPTSAVDHIEVLRDGAAAQYGSDAIAGVINIILKKNSSGGSFSATAGQNMDRSDGELFRADANAGFKLGENGFLNLSVSAKKQLMSNRADPIAACTLTARTTCLYSATSGTSALDPRDATANRLVTISYGVMPQKSINTAFNAAYDLGGVEVYAFGTFSKRHSDLWYSFRYPNDINNIASIYPNGYRPHVKVDEQDFEFAVGTRGVFAGWNWDLSNTYGSNRARQSSEGTINPTLGAASPTSFYIGTLKSTEFTSSLDLTRGYDVGGGNLQVSGGAQYRRETYETFAGDPASYAAGAFNLVGTAARTPGAQSSAGFQPQDAAYMARGNLAAYADVAYDPTRNITIGGAVRYEHYDDASGNTLIWKVNGRYAATPWLALRAAANTGFRAPAVAQQIYTQTTNQFRTVLGVNNVLLQIKTLPVDSAAAIALGATPLTPEKSTNFSAGFVLTPLRALNITVDAYQIKVKDRIVVTSTLTGATIIPILQANGLSPALSAQYYTNAIDTRTRGIDVVATYRHSLFDVLKMQWNFGFNYNETVITHIIPNPTQLSALSTELFDRSSRSNLTTNLPKTKAFLNNTTTYGDFTLSARLVRFGKFDVLQNGVSTTTAGVTTVTYPNDRHYGAKYIADLELAWKFHPNASIAVGANNLFNVYPDAVGAVSATLGQGKYPGTSPIGFTGGSYYVRLGVDF